MNEDELPEGWAAVPLGECVDILDGRRVPVNSDERAKRLGDVPYYGATGQVGWIDDCLFDEPLVLLGEDGAPFLDKDKPIAYLISGKTWVNNHAHVLRAIDGLTTNEVIKFALDAHDFREYVNGTTRLKLTQGSMVTIPVPLAPLAEQRRIVEKVEVLLVQVNAARARLAEVPTILKRFRQSILSAACSGRLTADWREGRDLTEASALMLGARRFVETQDFVRRRGVAESEVTPPGEGGDYPEGWCVARVRDVAVVLSGQTARNMDVHAKATGRYPWFKVGDMNAPGNERMMNVADAWLSESSCEALGLHPLPKGAVIFPKRGGAIATNKKRILAVKSCVDLNTMAFIPFEPIAGFMWWWFQSVDLGRLSDGSNVPQINHPDIEGLLVPVPPLEEQHEIVRRVDALFKLADAIEARVAAATARADKITQAILAKAFRGELVPTEAELARQEGRDYEPASALLARIRAEREASQPAPKSRTRGGAGGSTATAKPSRRRTSDRTARSR